MSATTTTRVFIPLTIRKRNGRPKIVPPADIVPDTGGVDPHVLKAIAKAWSWRRKLESRKRRPFRTLPRPRAQAIDLWAAF